MNILSVDLEDYFMVSAFENVVKRENWGEYESRIESNTYHLLDILNDSCLTPKATFFCLGWVAERYLHLIKEIHQQGHEIACHGYAHKLIYNQSKEEFRSDVKKAKEILEDIIGSEVIGYRAPSYSITEESKWALEILAEEGFKYDSSIFPIHHDFYGMPDAPRFPFIISLNGTNNYEFSVLNYELNTFEISKLKTHNSKFIIEFPISTVQLLGINFPISGGGYFRLFPYPFIKKGLKTINEIEERPFIFYLHPWEIDPGQPRVKDLPLRSRFRHYVNLNKTEFKFRKLLKDFQFSTVRDVIENGNSGALNNLK